MRQPRDIDVKVTVELSYDPPVAPKAIRILQRSQTLFFGNSKYGVAIAHEFKGILDEHVVDYCAEEVVAYRFVELLMVQAILVLAFAAGKPR